MKRIANNSRIEVWSDSYINDGPVRKEEDDTSKVDIIQIEPGNSPRTYMVEVQLKEDTVKEVDDQSKNDLIFASGKLSAMNIIVTRLKEECNNPNRNWYGSKVYSEIRGVLGDIEMTFKKEVDNVAGETVSK